MKRIDAPGHVGNRFKNGNKLLNILGTEMDGEGYFNVIQEELVSLLMALNGAAVLDQTGVTVNQIATALTTALGLKANSDAIPDITGLLPKAGGTMTGRLILATAGGTGITNLLDALVAGGSLYDSGWFSITKNTTYTKAHGLAAVPRLPVVFGRLNSGATGYEVITPIHYDNVNMRGASCGLDATNITLVTGADYIGNIVNTSVSGLAPTTATGEYRIIAIK